MPAELLEIDVDISNQSRTPLVLIHDGGGTCFQYYMLEQLDRDTFAIAYPYFESGSPPVGGLPALAQEYTRAICETIKAESVILGGWSFGGVISIEIARLIESIDGLTVKGILMIDSRCPWALDDFSNTKATPTFRDTTSELMKERTLRSYADAHEMLTSWPKPSDCNVPPAILIRADTQRYADAKKDDGVIGWSRFEPIHFSSVIDVPGDHWSMWQEDRLDNLTRIIKRSCDSLDE